MVVPGGGAVSCERGSPVHAIGERRRSNIDHLRCHEGHASVQNPGSSGETIPCRMTGVTLHGVVSPEME